MQHQQRKRAFRFAASLWWWWWWVVMVVVGGGGGGGGGSGDGSSRWRMTSGEPIEVVV